MISSQMKTTYSKLDFILQNHILYLYSENHSYGSFILRSTLNLYCAESWYFSDYSTLTEIYLSGCTLSLD